MGGRGYKLYSIPASFSHCVVQHGKLQAGEEVIIQIINSKELRSFRERCLLQDGKG